VDVAPGDCFGREKGGGGARSLFALPGVTGEAPGSEIRQIQFGGLLRPEFLRHGFESAVHELGGGQQWGIRLCGGYPRVHVRSAGGISRPPLGAAVRGRTDAKGGERYPPGRGYGSGARGKRRVGAAWASGREADGNREGAELR